MKADPQPWLERAGGGGGGLGGVRFVGAKL